MRNWDSKLLTVKAVGGLSALILLTSCATQHGANGEIPGFLLGLFHGVTIFFSLVGSLFTDYRIYAFPNSGFWYDVGYLMGASLFLGGGVASTTTTSG